mmetsp:Transcript_129723/g.416138  ORF Transcript_129723/g.416138 Transcript_129723/m.416138 type:complete len:372 (-) Transcript_129723:3359-4474(-)
MEGHLDWEGGAGADDATGRGDGDDRNLPLHLVAGGDDAEAEGNVFLVDDVNLLPGVCTQQQPREVDIRLVGSDPGFLHRTGQKEALRGILSEQGKGPERLVHAHRSRHVLKHHFVLLAREDGAALGDAAEAIVRAGLLLHLLRLPYELVAFGSRIQHVEPFRVLDARAERLELHDPILRIQHGVCLPIAPVVGLRQLEVAPGPQGRRVESDRQRAPLRRHFREVAAQDAGEALDLQGRETHGELLLAPRGDAAALGRECVRLEAARGSRRSLRQKAPVEGKRDRRGVLHRETMSSGLEKHRGGEQDAGGVALVGLLVRAGRDLQRHLLLRIVNDLVCRLLLHLLHGCASGSRSGSVLGQTFGDRAARRGTG